jgi:vacuolar-type H+-ATPase subunit H
MFQLARGNTNPVRPNLDTSRARGGREVDAVAEEKSHEQESLDHIKFYQDVIHKDLPNSPLYLIREKELEISGRVLSAKKKAEQIVADARKKATETLSEAESEGERAAREVEQRMIADAEKEAAGILANVDDEVADVQKKAVARRDKAVQVVVKAVSKV